METNPNLLFLTTKWIRTEVPNYNAFGVPNKTAFSAASRGTLQELCKTDAQSLSVTNSSDAALVEVLIPNGCLIRTFGGGATL